MYKAILYIIVAYSLLFKLNYVTMTTGFHQYLPNKHFSVMKFAMGKNELSCNTGAKKFQKAVKIELGSFKMDLRIVYCTHIRCGWILV